MGIAVVWDDEEKRVVRFTLEQRWTWDEFSIAKQQAYDMMNTVSHKVGVIMDSPPDVILPPDMLGNSLSALRYKHPNNVIIVFVLTRSFARSVINLLAKLSALAASTLAIAASVEEARPIIHKRLIFLETRDVTSSHR